MREKAVLLLMMIAAAGCQSFQVPESSVQEGPALSFMETYDSNGDGRVSTEEYDGRLRVFVALDLNRDSFITSAEAPEM
jgi:hypothetical protein